MTIRLGPLDAAFLELEEGDEAAHMHIGWAMIFDGAAGGSIPSLGEIRAQTEERLRFLPRFRRRLSSPRVGALCRPSWEPDERFDVASHILFNLTITNVPGPPSTLYGRGAPLRRVIPLVPIFAGHALGVAVVSYDGNVVFGLNADRPSVPDLALVREGIQENLAQL